MILITTHRGKKCTKCSILEQFGSATKSLRLHTLRHGTHKMTILPVLWMMFDVSTTRVISLLRNNWKCKYIFMSSQKGWAQRSGDVTIYRNSRHQDKTVSWPSHLYNGNPSSWKDGILRRYPASLYPRHWGYSQRISGLDIQSPMLTVASITMIICAVLKHLCKKLIVLLDHTNHQHEKHLWMNVYAW